VRVFLCLATVQVLADISSSYALANLMASDIRVHDVDSSNTSSPDSDAVQSLLEDPGPLEIGYSITAFGFLLFFGPLSIASSFYGALDTHQHRVLRLVKGCLGMLLAMAWLGIIVVLVWLLVGGNPFCSGLPPFNANPCSQHGTCYNAAQCHCDPGFGPESKLSGTELCSCNNAWCNTCMSVQVPIVSIDFVITEDFYKELNVTAQTDCGRVSLCSECSETSNLLDIHFRTNTNTSCVIHSRTTKTKNSVGIVPFDAIVNFTVIFPIVHAVLELEALDRDGDKAGLAHYAVEKCMVDVNGTKLKFSGPDLVSKALAFMAPIIERVLSPVMQTSTCKALEDHLEQVRGWSCTQR
jgi:hypothetical protein